MQTMRLTCDRCGTESDARPDEEFDDWEVLITSQPTDPNAERHIDLCPHCTMALETWLNSFKKAKPEETENVVPIR